MLTTIVLTHDPTDRYHSLTHYKGLSIVHVSQDHATEGTIVHIARPDRTHRTPAPTLTIDTAYGVVQCPVLSGDIIAEPTRDNQETM